MTDKDIEKRHELLKTITEKNYSESTDLKISLIIKNCEESKRELLAERITKIINQSKTEQEALKKIQEITMEMRSALLQKFMEMKLSNNLQEKISNLFVNLSQKDKEILAEKILKILNSTTDEKEINQRIQEMAKQG